jgi:hypothetical protein
MSTISKGTQSVYCVYQEGAEMHTVFKNEMPLVEICQLHNLVTRQISSNGLPILQNNAPL